MIWRRGRLSAVLRKKIGMTTQLNLREFGWALLPAIALLALWELGKLIARRSAAARPRSESSGVPLAETPTIKIIR